MHFFGQNPPLEFHAQSKALLLHQRINLSLAIAEKPPSQRREIAEIEKRFITQDRERERLYFLPDKKCVTLKRERMEQNLFECHRGHDHKDKNTY